MEARANLVNPSVGETLLHPHRNESSGHKSATSFAIYMWTLNDPWLGNNETGRVVKYRYFFHAPMIFSLISISFVCPGPSFYIRFPARGSLMLQEISKILSGQENWIKYFYKPK